MKKSCQVAQSKSAKKDPHTGLTRVMSAEDHTPTHPHTSKSKTSSVWKFTNGKELNKSEFLNYFERKVFRTIRKHQMLPNTKIFTIKKAEDLNTTILKQILETKFQVEFSKNQNISSSNLSSEAEGIFEKITKGNFKREIPTNAPLINISDKEISIYAKLKNIKGKEREKNKKIQDLFNKFLKKNQDLEVNILKAQSQLASAEEPCSKQSKAKK